MFAIFLTSGLFLGWSLGANDAANVFGTAVGTRMISFRKAAIFCGIFVILGAVVSGAGAAKTLGELGAVNAIAGAFVVALAAAVTVYWLTVLGYPVSTTQAIVGAIIGWDLFSGALIDYGALEEIVLSWFISPVLAAVFSALLYKVIAYGIKCVQDPYVYPGCPHPGGPADRGDRRRLFAGGQQHLQRGRHLRPHLPFCGHLLSRLVQTQRGAAALPDRRRGDRRGNLHLRQEGDADRRGGDHGDVAGCGVHGRSGQCGGSVSLCIAETCRAFSIGHGLPAFPLVPVSSSQAIVGSVIGIGLVKGGRGIRWRMLGEITGAWIATPIAAILISFISLFILQNVFQQKTYIPVEYRVTAEAEQRIKEAGVQTDRLIDMLGKTYPTASRFQKAVSQRVSLDARQMSVVMSSTEIDRTMVTSQSVNRANGIRPQR